MDNIVKKVRLGCHHFNRHKKTMLTHGLETALFKKLRDGTDGSDLPYDAGTVVLVEFVLEAPPAPAGADSIFGNGVSTLGATASLLPLQP